MSIKSAIQELKQLVIYQETIINSMRASGVDKLDDLYGAQAREEIKARSHAITHLEQAVSSLESADSLVSLVE